MASCSYSKRKLALLSSPEVFLLDLTKQAVFTQYGRPYKRPFVPVQIKDTSASFSLLPELSHWGQISAFPPPAPPVPPLLSTALGSFSLFRISPSPESQDRLLFMSTATLLIKSASSNRISEGTRVSNSGDQSRKGK